MRGQPHIVAGILTLVGLGFGGCQQRVPTPDELAQAALEADAPEDRELAAVTLSQLGKPAREQLLRVLGESPQPEVRAACIRGLAEQWYYGCVPLLLDTLEDDSHLVREQAGEAVQHLLRADYGYRADAPLAERRAVAKRLREWWQRFQRSEMLMEFARQQQGDDSGGTRP
jgi:HEAT repeat protein